MRSDDSACISDDEVLDLYSVFGTVVVERANHLLNCASCRANLAEITSICSGLSAVRVRDGATAGEIVAARPQQASGARHIIAQILLRVLGSAMISAYALLSLGRPATNWFVLLISTAAAAGVVTWALADGIGRESPAA